MTFEHAKFSGDVVSVSTTVAALFDMLPHAAALVSFIWACIRLYETQTFQGWIAKVKRLFARKEL